MNVEINNCNNIINGQIEIETQKLNIKYGPNGTGKSTISKAINLKLSNLDLSVLKPFGSTEEVTPEVSISDDLQTVKIYDEKYVNDYLFMPNGDNLHNNSFEVFLKPSNYDEKLLEINSHLSDIKNYINNSDVITLVNNKKNELDSIIDLTTNGISIKGTKLGKALNDGNKIIDIPNQLEAYTPYLTSQSNHVKWYKWFSQGKELTIDNCCPYCVKNLEENMEEIITSIDGLFKPTNVEKIDLVNKVISDLSNSLNDDSIATLNAILNNTESASNEDKEKIASFYKEIKSIVQKILFFQKLEYFQLKDVENIEELILSNKIIIENLENFDGELVETLSELNGKIDFVLSNVQTLVISLNQLNSSLRINVNRNKLKINSFLENVGMNYRVDVFEQKLKLNYFNTQIIVDAKSHLSWGEKNAFALCLFMFDAIKENPDLIVLDDPVSSFDINKKHGIMKFLFSGTDSLKNKTVLMLTHDLEPIINAIKVGLMPNCKNTYIKNHSGILEETSITKQDIKSIIDVSKINYLREDLQLINKLIHFRRYLELDASKGSMYDMISSVLKGKDNPNHIDFYTEEETGFSAIEISETEEKIQEYIPDFNYQEIRDLILNPLYMKNLYIGTNNRYEKIELFRIIFQVFNLIAVVNDNLAKFINEAFHIENCYIFQLDPYAYEQVPDYIIEKCNYIITNNFN